MKITKQRLREIIREEIQNLNEGLPWEQELDENWFTDLGAKAKQAYIKHNPTSKYAKGVKSGEREAPMTGKQKAASDSDKKEKQAQAQAAQDKEDRDYEKAAEKEAVQDDFEGKSQAQAFLSNDRDVKKQAMKDVKDKLLKQTGFELYPVNIERAVESGMFADYPSMTGPLGDLLENPNKKTLKAFDTAIKKERGYGMEGSLFGVSAKTKAAKKASASASDSGGGGSSSKKSDFGSSFSKAASGRGF